MRKRFRPPAFRAGALRALRTLMALASLWGVVAVISFIFPQATVRAFTAAAGLVFDHALFLRVGEFHSRSALLRAAGEWLQHAVRAQFAYIAGVATLFAAIASRRASDRARRRMVLAAALLSVLQLAAVHYDLNPLAEPRLYSDQPPAAALLSRAALPGNQAFPPRLYTEKMGKVGVDIAQAAFLPPPAQVVYAYRMNLQAGAGMNGIDMPWSADVERVLPREQALFQDLPGKGALSDGQLARLLQLSGTQFAVLGRVPASPEFESLGAVPNIAGPRLHVFRVAGAGARAWIVSAAGAEPLAPGATTIARLLAPSFEPRRQVVLALEGASPVERIDFTPDSAQATMTQAEPNRLKVQAHAPGPSFLVVAEAYDPEWTVRVDGQRTPLLRANQMFRAVRLGPGSHEVEFVYRPTALYLGAALSLATLVLIILAGRSRPTPR